MYYVQSSSTILFLESLGLHNLTGIYTELGHRSIHQRKQNIGPIRRRTWDTWICGTALWERGNVREGRSAP